MPWKLPPRQAVVAPEFEREAVRVQMCKALLQLPPQDAIGIACAVLLSAAHQEPAMVRRVLNEKVTKIGFVGESLITAINRVAK